MILFISRNFALFLLVLTLAACQTVSGPNSTPQVETGAECGAQEYQKLLWKPETILRNVGLPKNTRIIFPDTAVTMDYRVKRLNIYIGKSARIERVYCG